MMRVSVVLALLAALVASRGPDAPPVESRQTKSEGSLAADLRKARQESGESYQRYIWRASHLVREAFEERPWAEVESALSEMGLKMPRYGFRDGVDVEFKGFGFSLPNKQSFTLWATLKKVPEVSREQPTVIKTRVFWVYLLAKVRKPFHDVAEGASFADESVIGATLKRPKLREIGTRFEHLSEIRLIYWKKGFARFALNSGGHAEARSGFWIWVDFETRDKYSWDSARLTYWSDSSLDPPHTPDGKLKPPPDFVPNDLFEDPEPDPPSDEDDVLKESRGISRNAGAYFQAVLERVGEEDPEEEELPQAFSIADLLSMPADSKALSITDSSNLYREDLPALARFKLLEKLECWTFDGSPNRPFDEDALFILGKLSSLKSLKISTGCGGDKLARALAALPRLEELDLSTERLTDAGVAALAKSRSIRKLSLGHSKSMSDESLVALSSMPRLKELRLIYGGSFTEKGLSSLGKLKDLEALDLYCLEGHGPESVRFLSGLNKLKELGLYGVCLDEDVVKAIASLRELSSLDFVEVKGLSDNLIQRFAPLRELAWLSFRECPGITPPGVEALKNLLPGSYRGPGYGDDGGAHTGS